MGADEGNEGFIRAAFDQPIHVTVAMTATDFDRLVDATMEWKGYADPRIGPNGVSVGWRAQAADGRFESLDGHYTDLPGFEWAWAHWLGGDWTTVLLAKAFLRAHGFACEVIWDLAENPDPSYLLLTNYHSPR